MKTDTESYRRAAGTIEGGFRFIKTWELALLWWAQKTGIITWFEYRTWWACQEMVARRQAASASGQAKRPRFEAQEVAKLLTPSPVSCDTLQHRGVSHDTGDDVGAARFLTRTKAALARLDEIGLLSFETHNVCFAKSPEALRCSEPLDDFWAMLTKVPHRRRRVPVPREIAKLIAGGVPRSLAATIIGAALRCLFYDHKTAAVVPVGSLKCSWVADVFGVHTREVKRQRQRLMVEYGWLAKRDTNWRAAQRFGQFFTVALDWRRPRVRRRQQSTPPRKASIDHRTPPPLLNRKLPSSKEFRNQKLGGRAPKPQRAGFYASTKANKKRARDFNVEPIHLTNTAECIKLFERLRAARRVDCHLHDFLALAEHSKKVGRNPCGLFASLIRMRRLFISPSDEDSAGRRLNEHRWGRGGAASATTEKKPQGLSQDALFISELRRTLQSRGIKQLPETAIARARPDWPVERLRAAEKELLANAPRASMSTAAPFGAILAKMTIGNSQMLCDASVSKRESHPR